jgi:uncharacterized CHY-type Zn-finger protein
MKVFIFIFEYYKYNYPINTMRICPNCKNEIYYMPYLKTNGICNMCSENNILYSLVITNEDKTIMKECCEYIICYKCFSNLLKKPIRENELSSGYITPPSKTPPSSPPIIQRN